MAGRIALDPLALALVHPCLVLGMDRYAAAAMREHAGKLLVLGNQQITGRSAHEDLHAGCSGDALQLGQLFCVLRCRTDVEGMVAVHAVMAALELVVHAHHRVGVGIGVGHLEDGGHAAHHRRTATAFKVFLVLQPRLAEVDLAVDHPRQHVEPGTVDPPRCIGIAAHADDLAVAHGDIGHGCPVRGVDHSAGKHEFGSVCGHRKGLSARVARDMVCTVLMPKRGPVRSLRPRRPE